MGSGIASSLIHEVGHQAAELLGQRKRELESRQARLESDGAFRAPLPDSTSRFKRSFRATYGEALFNLNAGVLAVRSVPVFNRGKLAGDS